MSTETLSVDSLESVRARLAQLTHSLNVLLQELAAADPFPPWSSITSHLTVLNTQLSSLSSSISAHATALSTTNSFPLAKFPARAQENLLTLLLRKKLSPEVEEWVISGQNIGKELPSTTFKQENTKDSDDDGDANWALQRVIEIQRLRDWDSEYTQEELKGKEDGWKEIKTGLIIDKQGRAIRKGPESVEPQVVGALRIQQLFAFMNSGTRPD